MTAIHTCPNGDGALIWGTAGVAGLTRQPQGPVTVLAA